MPSQPAVDGSAWDVENDFTQLSSQPVVDGSPWDFGVMKRWQWMHDGYEVNGWIEFRSGGILRTSFERKDAKKDVWCYTTNGNIIATFGNCHHYLQLVDYGKPDFLSSMTFLKFNFI